MSVVSIIMPAWGFRMAQLTLAILISTLLSLSVFGQFKAANEGQATVVQGEPYGVGVIELPLAQALEMGWYADQTLEVSTPQGKVWLPACEESRAMGVNLPPESQNALETLQVYFLLSSDVPDNLDVTFPDGTKFRVAARSVIQNPMKHRELLQDWWTAPELYQAVGAVHLKTRLDNAA